MLTIASASSWTEAVFHVLAHVQAGPLPASCHDEHWIAYASTHFGPASSRELAADASLLATLLTTHEALAAAHSLAWLWTAAEARSHAATDLASLPVACSPSPVPGFSYLPSLLSLGPAAELLRAAAELELPLLECLPPLPLSLSPALSAALSPLLPAAPDLVRCHLALTRPLPRRGRLHNATIMIGAPGVAGADVDLVAWQAAHEATVHEVLAASRVAPLRYADLERRALGLLRGRARRHGLGGAHARWLATLDLRALGPIPDVDDRPQ